MLECHGMDILPYSFDTISVFLNNKASGELSGLSNRNTFLNVDDAADWCIFCADVRNTYGLPFEVTFEREEPGMSSYAGVLLLRS